MPQLRSPPQTGPSKFLTTQASRLVARNLQWDGGCSGNHSQRTREEKRIQLDLKRFFRRNPGEDQKKTRSSPKIEAFSLSEVRWRPSKVIKKGLHPKLERVFCPNPGEGQKIKKVFM